MYEFKINKNYNNVSFEFPAQGYIHTFPFFFLKILNKTFKQNNFPVLFKLYI